MPYPTAVVTESDSVTIMCSYNETGSIPCILWFKNDNTVLSLRGDCTQVGSVSNFSQYNYQCISGTLFTWTILHVSEDQHGDQWFCDIYAESCAAYVRSRSSTIYVQGMETCNLRIVKGKALRTSNCVKHFLLTYSISWVST